MLMRTANLIYELVKCIATRVGRAGESSHGADEAQRYWSDPLYLTGKNEQSDRSNSSFGLRMRALGL